MHQIGCFPFFVAVNPLKNDCRFMKDFLHLWVRHNPTLASYVQIFLKWVGAIFFRNGGALFLLSEFWGGRWCKFCWGEWIWLSTSKKPHYVSSYLKIVKKSTLRFGTYRAKHPLSTYLRYVLTLVFTFFFYGACLNPGCTFTWESAHRIRTSYASTPLETSTTKTHPPSIWTHQRRTFLLAGHFCSLLLFLYLTYACKRVRR